MRQSAVGTPPTAFKILAHFERGLMYYRCRRNFQAIVELFDTTTLMSVFLASDTVYVHGILYGYKLQSSYNLLIQMTFPM